MHLRQLRLGAALLAALAFAAGTAAADTLDRLRQTQTIRIAYRADAPPFSYDGKNGKPAGFMVELCQDVAHNIAQQLKLPQLAIAYVPVTAANRFDAITAGKADLLCEPTTELYRGASMSIFRSRPLSTAQGC